MANKPAKVPDTGPVRKKGPQKKQGNKTKNGKVFGNWQGSKSK